MMLTVGVLALVGCSKSDKAATPTRIPGRVDLSQLQQQFPNPTPEVSTCLNKLRLDCRYRTFDAAQAELDKLAQFPNLTEPQKKAIAEVTEQIKASINMGPGRPAQ